MAKWDPIQAECVKQSFIQEKADRCMNMNERIKEKTLENWKQQ